MTTLDGLGAGDLIQVVLTFRDALKAHQHAIDRLNVYPVPDGDTGTNMALTLASVAAELDDVETDLAPVCRAIGHGALMGARGNSGVILSQILRGLTQTLARADDGAGGGSADGALLASALEVAAKGAYEAVGNPVEGTILTVIREASEGAAKAAADDGASLVAVLEAAKATGDDALARTPELLPVLAAAGVVDAGGTGLLLLLDAFLHVVDGRPVPEASVTEAVADAATVEVGQRMGGGHGEGGGLADLRYEVMYLLEAPDESVPGFKQVWATIGDSIVVVGGEGLWNCHIHTDDIGASIEAAIDVGRPVKIRVTDLLEQVEEERWVREAEEHPEPPMALEPVTTAVVAVASGEGIRRIFGSLGVHHVITGGQSMNPSTAQLKEAVEAAPSDHVVILPNNKNIIAVAEQVQSTTDKTVLVVPTRGIPEGFAALIAYDPDASLETNGAEMSYAASNIVAGEVTVAVRASSCDAGPIAEGDFLGIGRDGIRAVSVSASDAAIHLLLALLGDEHEIVTLIEGDGASAGETRRITEWLAEQKPHVTAEIHHGGQPLYPYYLGVE